jgi:predicted RNase H-like nuclease (RuvC/YqgF family)
LVSSRGRIERDIRPELAAFRELEALVRHLGDELAGFRKRALQAETRLKQFESAAGSGKPTPEKLAALERENRNLRSRLAKATERTHAMVERVRFLREQQQSSTATGA